MKRIMRNVRLMLVIAAVAALPANGQEARDPSRDFDFLDGEWAVRVEAALPDGSWRTAQGRLVAQKVAGGRASMDSLEADEYRSGGVRAFNVGTGQWEYTMFDNLQMKGLTVWKGVFEEGVGTFEAQIDLPTGQTVGSRIVIDEVAEESFNWRVEMSSDGSVWRPIFKWRATRAR